MSNDLLLVVDEISTAFSYSWSGRNATSPWDQGSLPQWYGGTTRYPSSVPTRIGSFTFRFNGTSAAFTGNTPASSSPQTATVQIDNGTSFVINYNDPKPQTYMQWFTTPTLPEGNHTITISDIYGTAIDYAIVRAGKNTSLTGQTVIVDDDSPLIQYSGQWSRNTNKFIPGTLPSGIPYGNATHRTSNPGDNFTFQFSGTSIAVYGIFSWYNLGSLSAVYSINGTQYPSTISVTSSTRSYLDNVGEVANHVYFSQDGLPAGTHTLFVNITGASSQFFALDFITYNPAFNTLSSMPSFNVSSGTTSPSASHKSSGTPSSSTSGSQAVSQPSVSTGAIVGGVLGGLAFSVLVTALVLLILRRCRARKQPEVDAYRDSTQGTDVNYPNSGYPHAHDSSQMQERPSNLQPLPGNRPTKHGYHERTISATSPVDSSMTRNSSVDDTLPGPPSYDTIANRLGRQS